MASSIDEFFVNFLRISRHTITPTKFFINRWTPQSDNSIIDSLVASTKTIQHISSVPGTAFLRSTGVSQTIVGRQRGSNLAPAGPRCQRRYQFHWVPNGAGDWLGLLTTQRPCCHHSRLHLTLLLCQRIDGAPLDRRRGSRGLWEAVRSTEKYRYAETLCDISKV